MNIPNQPASAMTLRSGAKHGAALIGGLGLTWYFGWLTSDLIWSFWFTSLVTGFTMALVSFGAPLLRPDAHPVERGLSLGGGLLGLGFFTVHFGLFHYVHSSFLDLFIFYYSPDWLWNRMMELKKAGGPKTPAPGS